MERRLNELLGKCESNEVESFDQKLLDHIYSGLFIHYYYESLITEHSELKSLLIFKFSLLSKSYIK